MSLEHAYPMQDLLQRKLVQKMKGMFPIPHHIESPFQGRDQKRLVCVHSSKEDAMDWHKYNVLNP
jgi:hypothetical protein